MCVYVSHFVNSHISRWILRPFARLTYCEHRSVNVFWNHWFNILWLSTQEWDCCWIISLSVCRGMYTLSYTMARLTYTLVNSAQAFSYKHTCQHLNISLIIVNLPGMRGNLITVPDDICCVHFIVCFNHLYAFL